MTPVLEQLVREAMELTGAPPPDLMGEDAPIVSDEALRAEDDGFYLVGLIGGKDVGKSALINALVGKTITAVTSTGAGTEAVIAYAHVSQREALASLLEREAPGQYRLITHDLVSLRRQVLLDLPDIDSKYSAHLRLTRTMLRQMLFPVWVGSVEKYADQQPQQMLARVAEGNTPGNFLFCLNKVDQLAGASEAGPGVKTKLTAANRGPALLHAEEDEQDALQGGMLVSQAPTPWGLDIEEEMPVRGASAVPNSPSAPKDLSSPLEELRADYARRIARTLNLPQPPRVFMISARYAARFDLPALREVLGRQKSDQLVRESKQKAAARQDVALFEWLNSQQLGSRAESLARLRDDAAEWLAEAVGGPVLERVVPRLLEDPATRATMADDILQERVARWPVVNLVHTLLQPLFLLVRGAVSRGATPMQAPEALVDAVIRESGAEVADLVQSGFANLRQAQPALAALYPHHKFWENMPADSAARALQRTLADTLWRQRAAARDRLSGRSLGGAPIRWLLTIGALLWFPFIQPVCAALLANPSTSMWHQWRNVVALIVSVLGVDYLWKSAGFLIIYYVALWLALRWNTQRRVGRLLARWRATDYPDASLNLAAQTMNWLEELTEPIRAAHDRMRSLADRATEIARQTRGAA